MCVQSTERISRLSDRAISVKSRDEVQMTEWFPFDEDIPSIPSIATSCNISYDKNELTGYQRRNVILRTMRSAAFHSQLITNDKISTNLHRSHTSSTEPQVFPCFVMTALVYFIFHS